MSCHKFKKGQTVYFLVDPEFYDDECDGEILQGVITRRYMQDDAPCYDLHTSDGEYERLEEDLYATREETEKVVEEYFTECRSDAEQHIAEAREQLTYAKSYLANLNRRINHWRAKSKHQEAT